MNSNDAFKVLYRATPAMMHSVDPDGRIVDVSDHWLDVMGYERTEVVGRHIREFMTEHSWEAAKDIFRAGPPGFSGRLRVERNFVKKNGDVIDISVTAVWECDAAGLPLRSLGVVTDVTEQNRATRALKVTNRELEETNDELERFAFLASHDLQEPLRKVESACGKFKQRIMETGVTDVMGPLNDALTGAARMRALIDELLGFSRLSTVPLNCKMTNLADPVREALTALSDQIRTTRANVELGPLPSLNIDPDLVRLLFFHLFSNSLKYYNGAQPDLRIDAKESERGWIIRVSDRGTGVSAEHGTKIFEAFWKSDAESEDAGSGLGLAICQRIVERHEGKIRLDTDYPRGCRILIEFSTREAGSESGNSIGFTKKIESVG